MRRARSPQIIDDQQIDSGQLFLELEQPLLIPVLDHFVDQAGGGGKADLEAVLTSRQSQCQGDVGLARARVAHGQDVVVVGDVFTTCQFPGSAFCPVR